MTSRVLPSRTMTTVLGVLMVVATGPLSHRPALWIAGLAVAAVFCGVRFRSAATLAVVLTAATLLLVDPAPMRYAVAGLCATAYLVMRHAAPTWTTALSAAGFGVCGAVVAYTPFDVAWWPLVAPFGLLGAFALAAHPYLHLSRADRP